ncbi:3-hydroxyanthranilate 3, 4-dioxygenase [Sarcoptes scabiei]|uniref:3-hydroxyanthranilate 3,4-dioxygenase n=1 Tax=Sarcoptes scabiei TaxID=52283 RepID=A0A834VAY3_SARSC|nr:3-hydroxyanthranilate 3, 4-dioxygenase [Sarcoptes scabiei]
MDSNELIASEPKIINVSEWIQKNRSDFRPPIGHKIFFNGQLIVFFVGGPNERLDYHVEEGEEFFYMLKGDMCLNVIENGKQKSIPIREGEMFLLPPKIPHSPQRKPETIGLVIERARSVKERDCLRYYVPNETKILYERWFHLGSNFSSTLESAIKNFFQSEEYRTGIPSSNSRLIEAPFEDDHQRKNIDPINFKDWLENFSEEINRIGYKRMFQNSDSRQDNEEKDVSSFSTDVRIYGGNFERSITLSNQRTSVLMNGYFDEIFLWQLSGSASISLDGKEFVPFQCDQCFVHSDAVRY